MHPHLYTDLHTPSSAVIPVPRKGHLTDPFYYRGISLIPITTKIHNKLVVNRLIIQVDPILRLNQNGFRKGRSTIAQVVTLRRIVEEMNRYNKDVMICFVDIYKAFDSISRARPCSLHGAKKMRRLLLETMESRPMLLRQLDHYLYTNTKAAVITTDGETDFFTIEAGVLQGDTLAPTLIRIVLDYIVRLSLDQNS